MKIHKILVNHKWLALILLFFGIMYCSISLVNHYNFRTSGFDLGIYNNVIFDYSNFQLNDNPVMHIRFDNILSDHLSLYHFIYAPFRYILGSWTLLIFQILSILFGAIGIYKLIDFLTKNKLYAHLGAVHFLSMWGIFSALSFDYHDNVVGTMFIPWLILALLQKNARHSIIWTIIILVSKENMALWLFFVFAGISMWQFRDKTIRNYAIVGSIISILYFIIAIKIIMPSLASEGRTYAHIKSFSALGANTSDYIKTLFFKPKYIFSLLFENHLSDATYNGIKTELHYAVLMSGGIALLFRPQFLIMLIPIYLQKMFNNDFAKWGINLHYSVEFAPILTIAFFVWINDMIKKEHVKKYILIGATFICFATTYALIDKRTSKWYDSSSLRFWDSRHYTRSFSVDSVYSYLELIPADAKVCAQNMLVPHLAMREDIYTYPYIRDAEYIALLPGAKSPYPLSQKEYDKKIQGFKTDKNIEILVKTSDFILLKKVVPSSDK